ncbi:MAG TPA: GlsB/YeaQ/YmgE family stress response membrane protein [Pyrinomonadaceae bacterium]|nr:GlsB/YeaQ/YmgE family stress response membrane protein [Pyrinomonadaceae bacterium]
MFDIIGWIIFGLVAGLLARFLMPGKDPGGCIVTVILGIAGAIVGGFVARILGFATVSVTLGDRNFLVQLAFAVLGAIIILALYRVFAGKRA